MICRRYYCTWILDDWCMYTTLLLLTVYRTRLIHWTIVLHGTAADDRQRQPLNDDNHDQPLSLHYDSGDLSMQEGLEITMLSVVFKFLSRCVDIDS